MSLQRALIHKCAIQRVSSETKDGYGQKIPSYDQLPDTPCRLIIKSQRVASPSRGLQVITTYKLLLPAGTDVRMKDVIASVLLEDGSDPMGPFEVESIKPRRDFQKQRLVSVDLEIVGKPRADG